MTLIGFNYQIEKLIRAKIDAGAGFSPFERRSEVNGKTDNC